MSHTHVDCGCHSGHGVDQPIDDRALISARGLSFSRDGRTLIDRVDLDVQPGEIVTIIGPNGAGKTTLVKLLLGILNFDRGLLRRPFSTRIGYVPQSFEIDAAIPMTVQSFLQLGTGATHQAVLDALRDAGVVRTANQQLSSLSGGETQRVLIARALLRHPNLLVLDEPASGVDYTGEAELYDLIGKLRDTRKLGVLLISHDLHVVMAKSDRVICLNGHVCCSGKPEAVAQHEDYVRLFGPASAASFAVYTHHHDHAHDLSGAPRPIEDRNRVPR